MEHRGHQFNIDRVTSTYRSIRVPSLGIEGWAFGSYWDAIGCARKLIDRHLAEHGDEPVEKTAEERAERNAEVFGRF